MASITFYTDGINFNLKQKRLIKTWLNQIAGHEGRSILELNYVFVSDEALLAMNTEHLNHDTYTDIITFDMAEPAEDNTLIEGEIYISVERVEENASALGIPFQQEMLRVISHGLFHLCGYPDKSEAEAALMRNKENEALTLFAALAVK